MQDKGKQLFERGFETKYWVAIPVLLYFLFSFAYFIVIPVGESPDEPGHMRCIEQVAIERRLPVMETNIDKSIDWRERRNVISDYMCYHMPLYYVLSGQLVRLLTDDNNLHYEYPAINPDYDEIPSMFIHQTRESIWEFEQPLAMLGLRVASMFLGLVVLGATYSVAGSVFSGQKVVALMAVTILALWPQFIFISRAITNDSLATALAVIVLVILLQIGHPNRFPIATLIASLAFLTKLSVAFALGVVFFIWLIEMLFWAKEKRPYWRALLMSGGILIALFLILRMNPVLWANWQYSTDSFSANRFEIWQPLYWQQVYTWTLNSGWAWFGWLSVRPSAIHAQIWWLAVQISVILGSYAAIKKANTKYKQMVLLICAIWAGAVILSYIRVTSNRWQPQFRFTFAILPVLTTFMAGGTITWLKKQSLQKGALLIFTGVMAAYNVWLILSIIIPAYQIF
ncbi:MAG: hypothetical protein HF973_16280 [Chloroflexi bacterium]|nr:hypothetical protein [Chloroflexota bacterium]